MSENWEENWMNPDDSYRFYVSVKEIETEEQLIEQIEEVIAKYKE